MKVLALVLCLSLALAIATEIETEVDTNIPKKQLKRVAARWGIPSFEDEACVLCQYVVQRVESRLVQHLDKLDHGKAQASMVPSPSDPFQAPQSPVPAVPGTAGSAADVQGLVSPIAPPAPAAMADLSFEPSLAYKKSLIRSLRSRWGGSSILRRMWEEFLTDFCSQDKLPEIYVPVCSMMYESARKMMKLIYYGFPNDQVCLMAHMCGRNSYFVAPTAVHDPVMSLYWNNKRGLDGFEGGVDGVTKKELLEIHGIKQVAKPAAKATPLASAQPPPAAAAPPPPVDPTKKMMDHLAGKAVNFVKTGVTNIARRVFGRF
jgi:hypothetical protein